ncbi:hypothetical protein [Aeromicrobium endophyticum]|uniref:Uncharacterized protein n=1 Tax=Aeromicrobium endophyticum TaxID=2292704 RepID=A0A371NZF9_9ACTN|nr:hypothetical protein [Aeromicrobium endophyticum]REK69067.1 hypothetical protein DX116_19685 [Aeromicrobium endophyticum]
MTSAGGPAVYLRLAGLRATLDSPTVRLGTLAQLALGQAGARVMRSDEAGAPAKPRDDAFSWMLQHDRFLRDLSDGGPRAAGAHGGVVVSDDVRTIAAARPDVPALAGAPVLWAAPAPALLDPAERPAGALTLTTADADVLAAAGVRATSLLAWSRPVTAVRPVRRVVVAVGAGAAPDVLALTAALASGLPGRPVVDVLPDQPLQAGDRLHAPQHPWARSRLVRSCDLLLVLGRSAGADLLAAEATAAGARVHRIVVGAARPDPSPLAGALPHGWGLAPIDTVARAESLHVPLRALAGWLTEVSGARDEER